MSEAGRPVVLLLLFLVFQMSRAQMGMTGTIPGMGTAMGGMNPMMGGGMNPMMGGGMNPMMGGSMNGMMNPCYGMGMGGMGMNGMGMNGMGMNGMGMNGMGMNGMGMGGMYPWSTGTGIRTAEGGEVSDSENITGTETETAQPPAA